MGHCIAIQEAARCTALSSIVASSDTEKFTRPVEKQLNFSFVEKTLTRLSKHFPLGYELAEELQ